MSPPGADRAVVAHLQRLIRFRTVNPPGDELALARWLASVLAAEGIEHELYETAPDRAAIVARLRGRGPGGPLLLLAHSDVVGVEAEHWTVDPFAGEVRDGWLYGRGAIDDKGMLAVNLQTMLLLKRLVVDAGLPLERDVVFVATPDEETGSEWGLAWLLAHHPDVLAAEYALNEGGRVRVVDGHPLYAAVQTAEKVPHLLAVAAEGPSGHASVPLPDNAILRLGRALAAIGAHAEPLRLTPTTEAFFRLLAAVWPDAAVAAAMADLTSGDAGRRDTGERRLRVDPMLDAVLRTGISPVRVAGGVRDNVIPADATALLNVRTLPGEPIDDVAARLQAAVADDRVRVTVAHRGDDAPASPVDGALYAALAGSLKALRPELAVVPYLSTGATDNARLRRAGIATYGILPFPLAPADEARMHGHDERVSVDGLAFGLRVVFGAVARLACPAVADSLAP
jgi:acetylornithine deacetylase/succinyl-diaminopimelate desuccinylase-like protein